MHSNIVSGNTTGEAVKRLLLVFGGWFVVGLVLCWAYNELLENDRVLEMSGVGDEDESEPPVVKELQLSPHQILVLSLTLAMGVVGVRLILEAVEAYFGKSIASTLSGVGHCENYHKVNATFVTAVADPAVFAAEPVERPMIETSYPVDNGDADQGEYNEGGQEAYEAPPRPRMMHGGYGQGMHSRMPQPPMSRPGRM